MCAKMRLLDTHLLRVHAAEVVLFTVPLLPASSNGTHFCHSSISEKKLLECFSLDIVSIIPKESDAI